MNILLIDGGKAFRFTEGRLNHTLHQTAREILTALGHAVKETVIEQGYDTVAEVEKWLWMDAVVWQIPGWWMGEPWTVKKGDLKSQVQQEVWRSHREFSS